MWEIFVKLCEEKGVTTYRVGEETGIKSSTFSGWRRGLYTPKQDKLQKIADYFGVPLSYLMTGEDPEDNSYYVSPEAAEMAQDIYENSDLRLLFDAARGCTPDQLRLLQQMAESWKTGEK